MIKIYSAEASVVTELSSIQPGCWISLTAPTEAELTLMEEEIGVEMEALKAALDEEERSRIEIEDNYTMILVDIPTTEERHGKQSYQTMPMSIIITKDVVLTVCLEDTPVLVPFTSGRVKNFYTHMKPRFILQLLYRNASMFLQYLRSIDKKSEIVEKRLHSSTQNKELIQLLELEKSLVYFTTSLRSNEVVLEKLLKTESIKKYPEDTELLEDVIVENKQAIEMANIYSGILSGMMDAFASVISNNLNIVMKILALVTIVMAIPTMIFSAYGMNVNPIGMPFADSPFGFLIVIVAAIILSCVVALLFMKHKMFK